MRKVLARGGAQSLSTVPSGYTGIYNFSQLIAINTNETTLSGKYILMSDITFTEQNNKDFVPIGALDLYPEIGHFTGVFDGNNHKIIGVNLNNQNHVGDARIGFFGSIENAEIRNLGVVNSTVALTNNIEKRIVWAGGIVYGASNSTIENCFFNGSVTATDEVGQAAQAGGIVCIALNSTIKNCYNSGNVLTSYGPCSGGVVGWASWSTIENCFNTGSVTTYGAKGGTGLCGTGGIIGSAAEVTIKNCYNVGLVTATPTSDGKVTVGGIIGGAWVAYGEIDKSIMSNCYFLEGKVSGNNMLDNENVSSVLIIDDGTARGNQKSGAKTATQMAPTLGNARSGNSIFYVGGGGWDFSANGVWTIVNGENNGYPILRSVATDSLNLGGTDSGEEGEEKGGDNGVQLDAVTLVAIAAGAVTAIAAAGYFVFLRSKP